VSLSVIPGSFGPAERFKEPDFEAPIDVAARIARVPESATIRGLFFCDLVEQARKRNVQLAFRPRYLHFQNYPMREWVALLAEAAARFYPNVPLGEALRRMGRGVYLAFSNTLAGRVLFSTVGSDFATLIVLAAKAWHLADPKCTFRIAQRQENSMLIELRNNWSFPDTYNVGIFEGAAEAFGVKGIMRTHVFSDNDLDVFVAWEDASSGG
jgi:uncharacterized protein (TIGR02265 family)